MRKAAAADRLAFSAAVHLLSLRPAIPGAMDAPVAEGLFWRSLALAPGVAFALHVHHGR